MTIVQKASNQMPNEDPLIVKGSYTRKMRQTMVPRPDSIYIVNLSEQSESSPVAGKASVTQDRSELDKTLFLASSWMGL
jgi:hypothetical protein